MNWERDMELALMDKMGYEYEEETDIMNDESTVKIKKGGVTIVIGKEG